MATRAVWSRETLSLALLAPLLAGILAFAATTRWHSSQGVDQRTYVEMVRGVARYGLPYTVNGGDATRFPELRARWSVPRGGRLWGQYPPLFPYVAAPFFRLGGIAGVLKLNLALLVTVALGAYALGRRLARDPLVGTATAYVAMLGAPTWTMSYEVSSYTLGIALITWAMYFALRAAQGDPALARRAAIATGVLGGLASATHLFVFPMAAGAVGLLFVLPADDAPVVDPSASLRERLRAYVPTVPVLTRGACALAAMIVALLPVSALNHARFGTWNPVTYGPCVWRSCAETGASNQTPGAMLAHLGPILLYIALVLALVWLVRRTRSAVAVLLVAAMLLSAPESEYHRRWYFFLAIACGYLIDASFIPLRPPYSMAADKLGNYLGPFVLKSTLQGSPVFALALAPRLETRADRNALAVLALPCAAVYLLFAMRSNMPPEHAIGYSFMHFRYIMPTAPVWAAIALWSAKELPWRRWHLAVVVVAAVLLGAWLLRFPDDGPYVKRVYLLRVTLVLAFGAFVLLVRSRSSQRRAWAHAAALAASLAIASGMATTMALDGRAVRDARNATDANADALARLVPQRAGIVGWAPELDAYMTGLLVDRDIVYADLYETTSWTNFRTLIDVWRREGREVYALFPAHIAIRNPWSELRFETVSQRFGLVHIVPATP